MATLQSAKEKYARSMSTAPAAYNAAKGRAQAHYAEGVARFLGGPPAAHIVQRYNAGMAAAQYRPGDPERWASRYREKMTGG